MLRAVLLWLPAAAANGALAGSDIVKACLSQASKAPLECRAELLRGVAWLADPKLILSAFADGRGEESQADEEAAYLKAECRILQVSCFSSSLAQYNSLILV